MNSRMFVKDVYVMLTIFNKHHLSVFITLSILATR